MRTEADETRSFERGGGTPPGGKPKVPMKPKFGRHAGLVWAVLIWGYTFSGAHSAGPIDTPRDALG